MSDPIVLTDQEKMIAQLAIVEDQMRFDTPAGIVDKIVAAINRNRVPDPVGTIRKHVDESGDLAIRRYGYWLIIPGNADAKIHRFESNYLGAAWELIYSLEQKK